jgi:hypothetical protein
MSINFQPTRILVALLLVFFSTHAFSLVFSTEEGQVFIQILEIPKPVYANDKAHLVYEIYLTNFHSSPIQLSNLKLKNVESSLIAEFTKEHLFDLIHPAANIKSHGHSNGHFSHEKLTLAPGNMKILYMWVVFPDTNIPSKISHDFLFIKHEDHSQFNVHTHPVTVSLDAPLVIRPPVVGANWLAVNAPCNTSEHRKSHLIIQGHDYFPERYAIDFVQINKKGNSHIGDKHKNASYYCYGKEIFSVAPGTVVAIKDNVPENTPNSGKPTIDIDMENLRGNYILVDIGNNTYAFYGHLMPNSLTVKVGEVVAAGKILGKIGNSGNSTEPHLHFHLVNKPSVLAAESIPYVYTEYWAQPSETIIINSKPELQLVNKEAKKITNQLILQDTIATFK